MTDYGRQLCRDIIERALWTFAQGFLGAFTITDLSTARTAALAGVMALLSLVKSIAASRVGGTLSPASMARR